jgi:hypothetical protein
LLRSTSRKEIEAECFATDETILYFVRDFDPKGCVWLVHGNDLDVITDHTDAAELDAILKPAQDLAIGDGRSGQVLSQTRRVQHA